MSKTEILTENLRLLLQTPQQALALVEAMSPADRAEVSADWLARVKASTSADPWLHGFVVTHRDSGAVIGSCGYTGPPGPDAIVEIAYGIDPAHQGRGYATEAALALIAFAFGSGRVRLVRANTRPEENASTRVLTKCGFQKLGEVMDPVDGLIWRWELRPSNAQL
ncbi:MAG: GNAT family N-acetyltransferase [Gemmatimonadales bacterium]